MGCQTTTEERAVQYIIGFRYWMASSSIMSCNKMLVCDAAFLARRMISLCQVGEAPDGGGADSFKTNGR